MKYYDRLLSSSLDLGSSIGSFPWISQEVAFASFDLRIGSAKSGASESSSERSLSKPMGEL